MKTTSILLAVLMASPMAMARSKQSQTTRLPEKAPQAVPPTNQAPEQHDVKTLAPSEQKTIVLPETTAIEETKPAPAAPVMASSSRSPHFGFHAALGFPHPTTAGLDYLSPSRQWGVSAIGGAFKQEIQDKVNADIQSLELQARYHPWSSAFYIGLGAGNHTVKADKTENVQGTMVRAEAEVKASYVTPQIGWIAMWDSGFTLGFQLGALIPSSTNTSFTSNAPTALQTTTDYLNLKKDVEDNGDKFGKMTVPYVSLLRVGWMF